MMSDTPFSELLNAHDGTPDGAAMRIPEDWMQGRAWT